MTFWSSQNRSIETNRKTVQRTMQRQLILMRHGHAEEGRDDFARRLTAAGRAAARHAGRALARAGFSPQLILTSPAPRSHETAELVAEACDYGGAVRARPGLYLGEEGPYLAALHGLPAGVSRVLLVGHNPTLSVLAHRLWLAASPGSSAGAELRPAEYAQLNLELDAWHEL
jgi:phosphohistidine phosphatase